ncbi:MAG: agmatinase family protein [Myxococcales bacterium]|nr:agmatinase family protein [Polyangiaceae bacterium]MDW8250478.1 agmatinase family protein [Myxococcales bacterium]
MTNFDPDAAAQPGTGIFGLPTGEEESTVVLLPVPFDATTSYRRGAAEGPVLIFEASKQVDLFDRETGRPYRQGIFLREPLPALADWNARAREAADPILQAGGDLSVDPRLPSCLAEVNEICAHVNEHVYEVTRELLTRGKLVGVVGGDHSVPFGAIRAFAERFPGVGILHIDAHADLREAFEGFTYSHASIMYNVMRQIDGVARLVQVGIRDFSERELDFIEASRGRIKTHFDMDMAQARFSGETFQKLAARIVEDLPPQVYISLDIDGLDPALCPGTGTPVPGGLSFHEASFLVGEVARSGRKIVGFDLTEVAPGPHTDAWNGIVGARILYKLIGWSLATF